MKDGVSASAEPGEARRGGGAMFDGIAARYDALNRVLSLGLDQSWRRKTMDELGLEPGGVALDLATGTGDLAIMIAHERPGTRVIGVDPAAGMRRVAGEEMKAA